MAHDLAPPALPVRHPSWGRRIFHAKAAARGGVLRRSVRDVEREIGREALIEEVRARGFHLIECGGQFIIICNAGDMRVIC
ncbi:MULTISPECIES: hypothetical protein [unclassified Rhodosalinus]|uniref:hypothetical protein n=1 Tax=unclassified Rhodosalinus TaxID=2630183 RepID=UPI003524C27A